MVVNAKMQEAYHEAIRESAITRNRDLAQISDNGATDSCASFENMVISMTGATKGYPTYDQLKATGMIFHPNCRHTCRPLRDFSLLSDEDQELHRQQMSKLSQNLKKAKKKT